MKQKILLWLAPLLFSMGVSAANIRGSVFGVTENGNDEPLMAADVFWLGSTSGTTTNAEGQFEIARSAKTNRLVVAYYGYIADTITVGGDDNLRVRLKSNGNEIDEVLVQARQKGTFMSKVAPITTEVITYAGLCKMACCNLAESFENSATVTVGFSDAVSGTRQIRMLGLAGIYTQMLDESRPIMRGLSSTYGLGYTPGMWLEGIQVSKGSSSVVTGYDAITGQINLEHRKPTSEDRLFVNAYLDNEQRGELNVVTTVKPSDKLNGNVLAHVSADKEMHDANNDGFADVPKTLQGNAATRWIYSFNSGAQLRVGARFLWEEREAGQLKFNRSVDHSDTAKYGSYITNRNFNAYAKLGTFFGEHPNNSFALVADYTLHEQNSFFGQKTYNGTEHSTFLNGLVQLGFGELHSATFGLSLRADVYDEEYAFGSKFVQNYNYLLHENEYVGGVFGEYTLLVDKKFTAIAGLRIDYNNLYKTLVTPRAHLKYNITETLVARASAGRGLRSPNVIADNIWIMANQREIVALEKPKMEEAWTYGASVTKYIRVNEAERASVSVDVFRTQFVNQLIVDQEVGSNQIWVYNLAGKSYANNYQIDAHVEPVERLNLFATFRYSDTKVKLREMDFVRKPLVDNFKGLLNVSYATKFNKWIFDVTAQLNGQSRLPNLADDAKSEYEEYSPVYPMFFAQVTKRWRELDVYLGCENIANYTQPNPIIYADQPGNKNFNASVIWGPLMGRKVYLGMRWTL